jgi:putative (di)nucleoside polyphosphate hydrolase
VFHRIDFPPERGWQFPQGGIEGEGDIVDEARRELREEIGTDAVRVCTITDEWFAYDFPESIDPEKKRGYDGQAHRWVLAEFITPEEESKIGFSAHVPAEFDTFRWMEPEEIIHRVVDFKRDSYRTACRQLGIVQ